MSKEFFEKITDVIMSAIIVLLIAKINRGLGIDPVVYTILALNIMIYWKIYRN